MWIFFFCVTLPCSWGMACPVTGWIGLLSAENSAAADEVIVEGRR